jgi:hypothetical protein
MIIEDRLKKRLQALAKGKMTVDEVLGWINKHFVALPEVYIPKFPKIPSVEEVDIGVDEDEGEADPE